jgi:hypothetical protein
VSEPGPGSEATILIVQNCVQSVSTARIAATLTPTLSARNGVITITGISDHLRLE